MDKGAKITIRLRLALLCALAACITMLYDCVINWDNLQNMFGLERILSPTYLLIYFFLLIASLLWLLEDFSGEKTVLIAIRKRLAHRQQIPEIIIAGVEPWEKDIYHMCERLNIHDIMFFLYSGDGEIMASSIGLKNERPIILLDECFLNKYRSYGNRIVFYNMVKFLLAHELAHVYYGDSHGKSDKRVMLISLAACFGGLIGSAFCIRLELLVVVYLLLFASFYMMGIMFPAFGDERYWGQIDEFRADRLGMQISATTLSIFGEFSCLFEENTSTGTAGWYHRSSLFRRLFRRHIDSEEDLHPSWKTRVKEIEKCCSQKWGLRDHVRYTWRFVWNLRLHKNWRI